MVSAAKMQQSVGSSPARGVYCTPPSRVPACALLAYFARKSERGFRRGIATGRCGRSLTMSCAPWTGSLADGVSCKQGTSWNERLRTG